MRRGCLILFFLFISFSLILGQSSRFHKKPKQKDNSFRNSIDLTYHSIGDPTPEEQLALELINRARFSASNEAIRLSIIPDRKMLSGGISYFNVNLSLFKQQMSTGYPQSMPLAFSSNLLASARRHSWDMLTNCFQGHIGSDGSNPGSRMLDSGFFWNTYGENAYAAQKSTEEGHAAYEIDWGCCGIGGMQDPPGHRINIHNGNFREAGIGIYQGLRCSVGPFVSTQNFARRNNGLIYITGVIYLDFNNNNFYDLYEGVGGIFVLSAQSSYYSVSSRSGGYSLPVTTNGIYEVCFTDDSSFTNYVSVFVTNSWNRKLDYNPPYSLVNISGKSSVVENSTNHYSFNRSFGGASYQLKYSDLVQFDQLTVEENTNFFDVLISTNYTYLNTTNFQLRHPQAIDQHIVFKYSFVPISNSVAQLYGLLKWATTNQVAAIQVSSDQTNWSSLWSKRGNSTSGDLLYAPIISSLNNYTNKEIFLRISYLYESGQYYFQTGSDIGWNFKDLVLSNILIYENNYFIYVTNAFSLTVDSPGKISLRIRPEINGVLYPFGQDKIVNVVPINTPIRNFSLLNGNLNIFFYGHAEIKYVLQKSYNLMEWEEVASIFGNNSIQLFGQPYNPLIPFVFYRIIAENE